MTKEIFLARMANGYIRAGLNNNSTKKDRTAFFKTFDTEKHIRKNWGSFDNFWQDESIWNEITRQRTIYKDRKNSKPQAQQDGSERLQKVANKLEANRQKWQEMLTEAMDSIQSAQDNLNIA